MEMLLPPPRAHKQTIRTESGIGAVCKRTALFTDVGIYEACNNKSEIPVLPQIGDAPSLSRRIEDRPRRRCIDPITTLQ